MDSSTILIDSFMIFSIGRTTVSGLNFDPYFFLHIVKGSKALFLLPLLMIDQGPPAVVSVTHRAYLSSVFLVLENGRHRIERPSIMDRSNSNLSQDRNDYPCPMGLHPSLNVVRYCLLPRHSCNRHL